MAKKASKKEALSLMDLEKGDSVYMYLFSGAAVGRKSNEFKISKCNDKTITVETASGPRKFNRKNGVQIDANKPRYSNFILAEPDDDEKAACVAIVKAFGTAEKAAKAEAKKPKPKPTKVSDEDEYEDADSAEDKPKAKTKSKGSKPAKAKKSSKKADEDDDLEDDED